MGVCGISVTFFVLSDIINLFNLIFKIKKFRYYSVLIALTLSALCCIWSVLNVAFILNIKEMKIKAPELPVDSLKIVQLSDIHIDKFTSKEIIKKIFAKAQSLNPDLIIITGDVLDTDINKDDKFRDYGFDILKAPYGVFAITGNHERRRLEAYFEMCEKLGIKALQNENFFVEGIINIAGVNDNDWRKEESIKTAFSGITAGYPVIFLSHRPETFDASALQGHKIIQFSGHTHAGQIPPIEIARRFFMKYNYGWYAFDKSAGKTVFAGQRFKMAKHKNPESVSAGSAMYITSGTRWWGPPMRFGNTCEIAVITLEKK
jgi:predicted MPP superfamily phosphohydrolase